MEIRQGSNRCTLGFVDAGRRIAYSAGHCRGSGPVTDADGNPIGVTIDSRTSFHEGAVVSISQVITDDETIQLAPEVTLNDVLPGGRALRIQPGRTVAPGDPVCHFGVATGETCGTVDRANPGWFTMANGVVSQKGDSGGPVYVIDDDHAVIVGLFNSTWGEYPAAVNWP